jgi:hypothetical protein
MKCLYDDSYYLKFSWRAQKKNIFFHQLHDEHERNARWGGLDLSYTNFFITEAMKRVGAAHQKFAGMFYYPRF